MTSDSGPTSLHCDLPLGREGLVAHNELVLSGSASSPLGIAGVVVQVDERQWNAGYGLDDPAGDGDADGPDRSGYSLRIDTSSWEPGPRHVTVAAFDRDGRRSAIEGVVEVRPFGPPRAVAPARLGSLAPGEIAIRIEQPRIEAGTCEVHGPLEISGWAHARDGVEAVLVTLDGDVQHEALSPIMRPDLLSECGAEVAAAAGFALRLDPTECPPGRHSLTVVALGSAGGAAGVEAGLLCQPATEPGEGDAVVAPAQGGRRPGDGGSAARPEPDDPAAAEALMWQDRALLSEADAALSRAEAELARRCQEATLATGRELERGSAEADSLRAELSAARDEAAAAAEQLSAQGDELRRHAALIDEYEHSLSWRLTRPLRRAMRALRRGAADETAR